MAAGDICGTAGILAIGRLLESEGILTGLEGMVRVKWCNVGAEKRIRFSVSSLAFRAVSNILENQIKQNMENKVDTGLRMGFV